MIKIYLVVRVIRDGHEYATKNLRAFGFEKDAEAYRVKYIEHMVRVNGMVDLAKELLNPMTEEDQLEEKYVFPLALEDKYGFSTSDFEIELEDIDLFGIKVKDNSCDCVECDGRGSNCSIM